MSTPTIEIEASEDLERSLKVAVLWLTNYGPSGSESILPSLKAVLADVVRARCLAKRHDEQQIHSPLPRT